MYDLFRKIKQSYAIMNRAYNAYEHSLIVQGQYTCFKDEDGNLIINKEDMEYSDTHTHSNILI